MKKLLSIILILSTLLSVCVVTSAAKDLGDNITWTLEKGSLRINGSGDMSEFSSPEELPWHESRSSITSVVIGEGVTSVSSYAFSGCRSLFNVSIASTVKRISPHAFENCPSVKELTVPASVTEIGEYAFYNCTALRDLYLNAKVTTLSEYSFANCKSVNILSLPNSLETIGDHALEGCSGLFQLNLNSSLKEIGENAFYDCKALADIKLPSSVDRIGTDAFVNTAYYNNSENWNDNGLYIDSKLVSVKNDVSGEYTVIDSTSYIAGKVFAKASFDFVMIPVTVTNIEADAFEGSKAVIRCYEGSYAENYAKTNNIPCETIFVHPEPVFAPDGLRIKVSGLDGVAVIRTAYGEYETESDIKRAETHRSFTKKNVLKDVNEYFVQYRMEGKVTLIVRYDDGYTVTYTHDITKKSPKMTKRGSTVTFGSLDDFLVIRYAKGEYSTSNALKNSPECINISWRYHKEDSFTVTLEDGTYTFCVQYKDESYNFYTINVDSNKPRIFCIGDSLTMGIETGWGNVVEVPYPERLEEYTGYTTFNYGVGSDITEQIAMRMGSLPVYAKNITIPADRTPVAVTPYLEDGYRAQSFCYNGFAGVNDVEIAGVKGKLTDVNGSVDGHDNSRVYFTRNEPGEEVVITSPERIITHAASSFRKDDILIIWVGSNDLNDAEDTSYFEYLVEMQQQMIDLAGTEKFLIIGYTADNYIGIDTYTQCADQYNALMKEYWGEHFVDLKEYMATYKALEDFGIEPTTDDRYRLARGWIPKSFLERGRNTIHFNQIGYDCVEYLIEQRLYELEYIAK